MYSFLLLHVTTPHQEIAQAIAQRLLAERLAASVHIIGPNQTTYWWQDEIHHATEYLCQVRTDESIKEQAIKAIIDLHPYQVPEIFSYPLHAETSECAAWLTHYTTGEDIN